MFTGNFGYRRIWRVVRSVVDGASWSLSRIEAAGNVAKLVLYGIPALSLVGGVTSVAVKSSQVPYSALTQIAEENDYDRLLPPNNHFSPGIFATVETRKNGKVVHHLTCGLQKEPDSGHVISSPTMVPPQKRSLAEVVISKVRGQKSMWLDTVKVLKLSDEGLEHARERLLNGGSCERAIVKNLKADAKVCQVREVLHGTPVGRGSDPYKPLYFAVRFIDKVDCLRTTQENRVQTHADASDDGWHLVAQLE